ncbi:MAG: hypothetical protein OXC13_15885 [Caldilineaceae bacterium]|nr:hypothetical protein [Caldilineaceae bacterium]
MNENIETALAALRREREAVDRFDAYMERRLEDERPPPGQPLAWDDIRHLCDHYAQLQENERRGAAIDRAIRCVEVLA